MVGAPLYFIWKRNLFTFTYRINKKSTKQLHWTEALVLIENQQLYRFISWIIRPMCFIYLWIVEYGQSIKSEVYKWAQFFSNEDMVIIATRRAQKHVERAWSKLARSDIDKQASISGVFVFPYLITHLLLQRVITRVDNTPPSVLRTHCTSLHASLRVSIPWQGAASDNARMTFKVDESDSSV